MASIHDFAAVDKWRRERRLDRHPLRRLRAAFYKKGLSEQAALAELPESVREEFARSFDLHSLALAARHDSAHDGASKLVFRTSRNLLLESVILRIGTGRTTLCVSTQVGCAARCEFCATGRMGIARNLSDAEIVDQFAQSRRLLALEGRPLKNLVFMGMGEPFHNEQNLHTAIELLTDSRAFDLHPGRIMISTVGIPPAMVRAARRWPRVRLALSLHSVRGEVRRRLMPIAERHGLAELREALAEVMAIQRQPVMIEYLLLAGLTDTDEDARQLAEYLAGLDVHVNLIPYNPIDGVQLVASSPQRQAAFSRTMKNAGFKVTTRYSLGSDIRAACGQLIREHKQRKRMPC